MLNDKFALGVGQAHDMELAMQGTEWTTDDLKRFYSSRDLLNSTLKVVRGTATIQVLPPVEQTPPVPFEPKKWKTIKLGTEKSAKDLKKALERGKYPIGTYAEQILKKVVVAESETELDLVIVTPRELGFTENTRRDAIYERAQELGLQLCPNEVGPQLRLQYGDQPLNEWMVIGMEPLTDSDGDLRLFYVVHLSDGRWLHSNYGSPDDVWSLDYRFVFALPRK